jgi:hypothetical protein
MLNSLKHDIPKNFKDSIIKFIPKNDKKDKSINDYRPISITNYEYRIFTKILTNRLVKLNDKLFKNYQFCSIKGKIINSIIHMTRDMIFDSNEKSKDLFIMSIDQKKAFDNIDHSYLFNLLKHVNIGKNLFSSIHLLYTNSNSRLYINDVLSEDIHIKRSIKQGCPLSMWLYILCIEELLIRINSNPRIQGYNDEFNKWGLIFGGEININKTQILRINGTLGQENSIYEVQQFKILGIIFNKNGIDESNMIIAVNKLIKTLYIWNDINLDLIQRITALKTFIMSKIWFVINFINISNSKIDEINKKIFNFLWCGKRDFIKRKTIIGNYDESGLKRICLHSKIMSIRYKHFCDFYKDCFS